MAHDRDMPLDTAMQDVAEGVGQFLGYASNPNLITRLSDGVRNKFKNAMAGQAMVLGGLTVFKTLSKRVSTTLLERFNVSTNTITDVNAGIEGLLEMLVLLNRQTQKDKNFNNLTPDEQIRLLMEAADKGDKDGKDKLDRSMNRQTVDFITAVSSLTPSEAKRLSEALVDLKEEEQAAVDNIMTSTDHLRGLLMRYSKSEDLKKAVLRRRPKPEPHQEPSPVQKFIDETKKDFAKAVAGEVKHLNGAELEAYLKAESDKRKKERAHRELREQYAELFPDDAAAPDPQDPDADEEAPDTRSFWQKLKGIFE